MGDKTKKVLIVEDDAAVRDELAQAFRACEEFDFDVAEAADVDGAAELVHEHQFDVAVVEAALPTDQNEGLRLADQMLLISCRDAVRIVTAATEALDTCVRAMRSGAWDFVARGPGFVQRVLGSAVNGLRHTDQILGQEHHVLDEWLPEHEQELQEKFAGQYVAIKDDVVVAHGRTMASLGVRMEEAHASGAPPYVVYVGVWGGHD